MAARNPTARGAPEPAGDAGSWKLWLGAGAAAVAALGGYLLYKASSGTSAAGGAAGGRKKRGARKGPAAAASSASSAAAAAAAGAAVDSEQFQQEVASSLGRIQQGNLNGEAERSLLVRVRASNPADFSPRSRVLVAQWLILYHTIKQMVATNEAEYLSAANEQEGDMGAAWSWLDCSCEEADLESACDMLKLDVAQRLKDRERLRPIYEKVYAKGDRMGDEELLVTFTTAPLLGRWAQTRELGDRIRGIPRLANTFEEFHLAAIRRPDIPDYQVLYQLAEEEAKAGGDTPEDQIKWEQFRVVRLRIKVRDVECQDEAKREAIRNGFVESSEPGGWQDIPVSAETRMLRFGAIAQMLSLSSVPIPMVGPATDKRMRVQGYAELPASEAENGGQQIRQTESYELTREDSESPLWEGRYYLTQAMTADPASTVRITFDMQMELQGL